MPDSNSIRGHLIALNFVAVFYAIGLLVLLVGFYTSDHEHASDYIKLAAAIAVIMVGFIVVVIVERRLRQRLR